MAADFNQCVRFDLHLHSTDSDGRFSPREVLERSVAGGLEVIALTDHDLCTAMDPGLHVVDGRKIHVIQGAEVSGLHNGVEFHLLCYFNGEVPMDFRKFCEGQARKRAARYTKAVENIGLPDVAMPDAAAFEGRRSITRLHLAQALVAAGHTRNIYESFAKHTGDAHQNVPPIDVPFVECIKLAVSYGGITSWAHPPVPMMHKYLLEFVAAGLNGIEALRPKVQAKQRRVMRRMARDNGLFLTGGSDWHGWGDAKNLGLFAVHRSELQQFLDALNAAA